MDNIYSAVATIITAALNQITVNAGLQTWKERRHKKQRLKELLELQDGNRVWQRLSDLAKQIGSTEKKTVKLLLAIGARRSRVPRSDYWALKKRRPFYFKKTTADETT